MVRKPKKRPPSDFQLPERPSLRIIRQEILSLWQDGEGHPLAVVQPLVNMYPRSAIVYSLGECVRSGALIKTGSTAGLKPIFQLRTSAPKTPKKGGLHNRAPRK